ncbi:hypothetical protein J007_02332 [Cryptococcus neoformans]|nr:hypothetical protein J007_02332 [Cryptococcus neoformans var. grubii]OXC62564.1 hypothetical protein C358_02051 [Cryptococcus neoformans var. grubii MW-RSA852]
MVERCYGESAAVCCPSNASHGTNSGVPCTLRFEIYMHATLHTSTRTMSSRISTGKMAMAPQESVQPAVLYKLVLFALLMAVVPIATYFGTLNYLWDGSTTFAAISAIAAANLILVGYVVVAFREDAASRTGPLPEKKTS